MAKANLAENQITNDGEIAVILPYRVEITIEGAAPILFHRWSCEAVEAKANAAKGSKAKKTDDVESYLYRDAVGHIAIPGEYRRRVCVQRNAVTRVRPALNAGWSATFQMMVQTPEYISPQTLNAVIADAGRLVGVGDFRPSYGRFVVTGFAVLDEEANAA